MSESRSDSMPGDQRLKSLLAQQAQIQAQIASLLPDHPTSQHHRSPIHKPHSQRRSNIPRSLSSNGTSMARRLSDRPESSTMRSRTISQSSAPAMARVSSRGGASQQSNLSFGPGSMSHSFPSGNPAMEAWTKDQPLSSYTFSHSPPYRSMSQRQSELPQVPELDHIGEDPADFLTRTGFPAVTLTPSPINIPQPRQLSINSLGYSIQSPTTPFLESLTEGTTHDSNMSRTNSTCDDALLEGMKMVNCTSNGSYRNFNGDHTMYDLAPSSFTLQQSRRASTDEQSQLLIGAGGASHKFSQSLPSDFPLAGAKMEKTLSNESASSSSSSSSSRSKMRLQAAIAQARPLMPKGGDDNAMSRENSSQSMVRLDSIVSNQDKAATSKPAPYKRPKHARVFCPQCDSYPYGFRGEHELRRHQDREHRPMVKKWVCIEPTGAQHLKPANSFSRCKACTQQKKYGAYYNAAAHLRRAHFNPRPKGRSKNKSDDNPKRGGKGGGDLPSMAELKFWMMEVEEPAPLFSMSNEGADDESDNETYDDSLESFSSLKGGLNAFNNYDNDSSMLDLPSQPNDTYTMQSMHLSSQSQAQIRDMPMSTFDINSQSNFDNFSPVMTSSQNDPLAFYDLPTNSFVLPPFDDQLVGLDADVPFFPYPYLPQ